MKVVITSPVVVDIQEKQFAIEVNRLRDDPSRLSDFADGLCESVLAYLTSYYIGKLKTDHPDDFDKLARFMLGIKSEDEPVKRCPSNCTGNSKKKHEFKIGDIILCQTQEGDSYIKYVVHNTLKDSLGNIDKIVLQTEVKYYTWLNVSKPYVREITTSPEELYSLHGKSLYIIGYNGG